MKLRQAKYCNLKLFLMFLVIFGHFIEPMGHWIYRAIYAFHMPAFALLSGIFAKGKRLSMAKKLLLCYSVLQMLAVFLGKTSVLTPYWHLWYLLSNACWLVLTQVLVRFEKQKWLILFLAIVCGCLVGFLPQIGRALSLSRTMVFFPYFWWGFCLSDIFEKHKRLIAISSMTIAVGLLIYIPIPTNFFYQACAYGNLKYGVFWRIICYIIGFSICGFLLVFMTDRRFFFTKAGADTLTVYLFHAPIVLCLRGLELSIDICVILSIVLLWSFYKLQQGKRYFYGITEERGRRWHRFKKYTKSTPKRSTDSCSV